MLSIPSDRGRQPVEREVVKADNSQTDVSDERGDRVMKTIGSMRGTTEQLSDPVLLT
jgi:hypothetical protein